MKHVAVKPHEEGPQDMADLMAEIADLKGQLMVSRMNTETAKHLEGKALDEVNALRAKLKEVRSPLSVWVQDRGVYGMTVAISSNDVDGIVLIQEAHGYDSERKIEKYDVVDGVCWDNEGDR